MAAVIAGGGVAGAVVAVAQSDEPPPCEACADFVTGQPLREIPSLTSSGGRLDVTLTARTRTVTVGGRKVSSQTYSSRYAGPTWVVNPGDDLNVLMRNRLPAGYLPIAQEPVSYLQPKGAHTNLHVHGLHVSPDAPQDDVFLTIKPGSQFQYRYQLPDDHPAGIFWYHPHAHRFVDMQTFAGQAGAIIVRGGLDDLPGVGNLPDRVMVLQNTQVRGGATTDSQYMPPKHRVIIINGQLQPRIDMRPGESQRWRLANASTERFLKITPKGAEVWLLARDGVTLARPERQTTLFLSPGQRGEYLVRAGSARGDFTIAQDYFDQRPTPYGIQPAVKLATLRVTGAAMAPRPVPRTLGLVDDLRGPGVPIAARRRVVFQQSPPKFFVNGKRFGEGANKDPKPLFSPRLNTNEEWLLVNDSPEWHNFHIHINDYQVVARDGIRTRGQPEWADSVIIKPDHSVTVRLPFRNFDGTWVFHCHVLVHEDHGMMALVNGTR